MNRILIADDSALVRKVICDIINADPDLQVTDTCLDGASAFEKVKTGNFDILIVEMNMSKLNAVEILAKMKEIRNRTPVVILSSTLKEDSDLAYVASGEGPVEVVMKPFRILSAEKVEFEKQLLTAVKKHTRRGCSSVNRTERTVTTEPRKESVKPTAVRRFEGKPLTGRKRLLAIASSTGGPQALHVMIPMLPAHIGVPAVVVQHMPKGFTASLADRINQQAKLTVKEAEDGEVLKPDFVYIAPGGRHLEIIEVSNGKYACRVFDDPPVKNLRPCADVMYRSLCKCSFDEILCVVMTGMGADGSDGIEELKKKHRIYTITQDQDSCVVYGMPKAAYTRGLSDEVEPLTGIANAITKKLGV